MSKTKKQVLVWLAAAVLVCMVGFFAAARQPLPAMAAERAPETNFAAGKKLTFYSSTPDASKLESVEDDALGTVNKATFSSAADIAYVTFDLYENGVAPKLPRIMNFATGALEFRLKYRSEQVVSEPNPSADPRAGGIAMYATALGVMNADGTAAAVPEMELWDWTALSEGGNVMCHVIDADQSEWTELIYRFELQSDKYFKQLRLNLQSTFGATGTVYFTDFVLTYTKSGEEIEQAARDIVGTDATQSFVDKWALENGITKSYDETVRYNSNVNGSLKLVSASTAADMNAFLVLSDKDFKYNTSYTVTFYLKGDNLAYGDWPSGGWPLGIDVYNRYFYRDDPTVDPVYMGELLNAPFMKNGETVVTPKAFDAIEAGNGGMPSNKLQSFDWVKVQYTINPWVIWSNHNKADGGLHGEYFVYLGLRVFYTSGNIWLDDMSIVPSGCQIPVYVSQEPTMGMVGQLPAVANRNSELSIPKVSAKDKNNNDISSSAKVTVTDPDGTKVLDNVSAAAANLLTPSKKGEYTVKYSVVDGDGVPASQEYKFRVDEVRVIRADVALQGVRSRNYEVAEPTVYESDGKTVVGDAEVNVIVKSPSGTEMWNDSYDSFFGVSVTPGAVGDHLLIYEYTYEKDGEEMTVSTTYVINITINPLDIGQGDYRDNYVPGGHFEDITSSDQLISSTEIRYYPDDATKVTVNLKTDGGHSGNNYMQVDYKSCVPEVASWFYMIDLTQRPVVKDNRTKYKLQFYVRNTGTATAAGEDDEFLVRIELKKDTVTAGVPSALFTDIAFTVEQINRMTDWTLVELEWISFDDAFVFGDADLPSAEGGPSYHRMTEEATYDVYTCLAFGFYGAGDVRATLDFDDITFVKEGDPTPDYKAEYGGEGPVAPQPGQAQVRLRMPERHRRSRRVDRLRRHGAARGAVSGGENRGFADEKEKGIAYLVG